MGNAYSALSPRGKAIMKLAGVAAAGVMIATAVGLAPYASPKINSLIVESNPPASIVAVGDYLSSHPSAGLEYQKELSSLLTAANRLPSLSESDRQYMFETNAPLVVASSGANVCKDHVISRLDEGQRLEYLLSEMDNTESRYYVDIAGRMLKNAGEDVYNSLLGIFQK